MDHSIIPQEWKKFLSIVQSKYPSAIIAGGALRDTICDNPVKDVDIFISDLDPKYILDLMEQQKIADLFGILAVGTEDECGRDHLKLVHNIKSFKQEKAEELLVVNDGYAEGAAEMNSFLESFINYIVDVKYNGVMYQLIFIESDPVSYVYNDFDFGICKVYYDGMDFVVTEEFWYDFENKQLTIAGKQGAGQMLHTLFVHRPNLIKKFPHWKVVIDDLSKRELADLPPSYQAMAMPTPTKQDPLVVSYVWVDQNGIKQTRTKSISTGADIKPWHKPAMDPESDFNEPDDYAAAVRGFKDEVRIIDGWDSPLTTASTSSTSGWQSSMTPGEMAELIEKMSGLVSKSTLSKWALGEDYGDYGDESDRKTSMDYFNEQYLNQPTVTSNRFFKLPKDYS